MSVGTIVMLGIALVTIIFRSVNRSLKSAASDPDIDVSYVPVPDDDLDDSIPEKPRQEIQLVESPGQAGLGKSVRKETAKPHKPDPAVSGKVKTDMKRKRGFNAKDMIIYSEIQTPKYLDK